MLTSHVQDLHCEKQQVKALELIGAAAANRQLLEPEAASVSCEHWCLLHLGVFSTSPTLLLSYSLLHTCVSLVVALQEGLLLSLLRTVFAQDLTVSGGCQESLVIAPAVNVAEVKPSSCTNRARASDLGSTVEHR